MHLSVVAVCRLPVGPSIRVFNLTSPLNARNALLAYIHEKLLEF
ncbi:hypothetical protein Hanom_Chr11g01055441 [Helianthus anomalus]